MCDFGDTDLLYRDAGGEQRKLIDQALRLRDYLLNRLAYTSMIGDIGRLARLSGKAVVRYQRRYNRYYKQEQPM